MIELFLSSDGKHTVHVSAETPGELTRLAPSAKELYETILQSYGNKAQMWQEAGVVKAHSHDQTAGPKRIDTPQIAEEALAPRCPIHDRPMKLRQGAYGSFWSCSVRNPNGRWCPITKEVSSRGEAKKATA
jgi:hypothetical protein